MKKKNHLLTFSSILILALLALFFATRTHFLTDSDQLYGIAIQYLLDHDNSPYKQTEKDYQAFADYEGFGITEDNEYRYAYMWILDESFYVDENNKIRVGTGGSMPYKFYFKKDADEVVKYEIPKDGTEYGPSIMKMFPSSVARKMLKIDSFDDSKIKAELKEHYSYLEDTEIYYSDDIQDMETKNPQEEAKMNEIYIKVNGETLSVKLEDNTSAKAFVEKLKSGDIVIDAHDYGNFEKVGELGFSLPTNDEDITTKPGDLILYQGDKITLYYDTNTWSFTKLGQVQNVSQNELKQILGDGSVQLTFSLVN